MDINKLKTNLFIVNDFYSQLERLSKADILLLRTALLSH